MIDKKTISYGFLIWLIPLIFGTLMFEIRNNERALFESLIAVILSASIVLACLKYGKSENGLKLGIVWMIINLVLDIPLFLLAFGMPFIDYIKDIGITYLMIPIITFGFFREK